jgi:hypothetical protein
MVRVGGQRSTEPGARATKPRPSSFKKAYLNTHTNPRLDKNHFHLHKISIRVVSMTVVANHTKFLARKLCSRLSMSQCESFIWLVLNSALPTRDRGLAGELDLAVSLAQLSPSGIGLSKSLPM